MEEFYFLFALGFVWIIFAVFQDLKTREISNWLNFSLIAFVLAYRAFYSISIKDVEFFVLGLAGVLFFVLLGYLFYYGRVFAGGDAKLLMGLGGVLPYESFNDVLIMGGGFVFLLFFAGAIYTLAYSAFLIRKNVGEFKEELIENIKKWKIGILVSVILGFAFFFLLKNDGIFGIGNYLIPGIILILPWLYIYVRAIEKVCMIKKRKPGELQEGDWLINDVKIGGKIIKKSVHGLSKKEILMLKKAKKKVWIRDGVPFSPAFLFALILFGIVFKVFY
jgi:Flp pilus assembly protein protease CpaA